MLPCVSHTGTLEDARHALQTVLGISLRGNLFEAAFRFDAEPPLRTPADPRLRRAQASSSNDPSLAVDSGGQLALTGEAVLCFVVSHHIFLLLPEVDEAEMSAFREAITQCQTLAAWAARLDLDALPQLVSPRAAFPEPSANTSARLLRALLGVAYQSSGLDACRSIVAQLLFPVVEDLAMRRAWLDAARTPYAAPVPALREYKEEVLRVAALSGAREDVLDIEAHAALLQWEESSGFSFAQFGLLRQAFTLRRAASKLTSNERLEWLGDACLKFLASEAARRAGPHLHPTRLRSAVEDVVRNSNLTQLAESLGLIKCIHRGKSNSQQISKNVLAGCLEALFAALLVDHDDGLATAGDFAERSGLFRPWDSWSNARAG